MANPLIKLENVWFTYTEAPVLKNINLEIQQGEFLGIIGPNGCGKTTLLRLISGVLNQDSGKIYLNGKEINKWKRKEIAQIVGVVPQESYIPFAYTVKEVVMMGRTPHLSLLQLEGKKDLEIVKKAMELTEIEQFANRYLDTLSGGERQRVLIARALAQEPQILLLDEPTLHLDLYHQVEILDLVKTLNNKHGITVLFITHDLNLAAIYCQRLILLSEGELVCSGSPEEVIKEEIIQKVYKTKVAISRHPVYFVPQINLIREGENKAG